MRPRQESEGFVEMWGFHKWVSCPQMDGLIWKIHENPMKVDDLGVPLFQETPMWLVVNVYTLLCNTPSRLLRSHILAVFVHRSLQNVDHAVESSVCSI